MHVKTGRDIAGRLESCGVHRDHLASCWAGMLPVELFHKAAMLARWYQGRHVRSSAAALDYIARSIALLDNYIAFLVLFHLF